MESLFGSIKNDFGSVIINGLIFLVSFLWRDLLLDIEKIYFPDSNGIIGRIMYIVIMSFVIISIAVLIRNKLKLDSHIQFEDTGIDPEADDLNNYDI
jgi:hypothetical protein